MFTRKRHLGLSWWCHAECPAESTTTTGASVEKYDPEDSAEDVEGTTHPSIHRRKRRLQRRDDGPDEFSTMTEESEEEDDPEDLTTTTEASAEETEEMTRPSERLQQWRRRCVYGPRELTTTT